MTDYGTVLLAAVLASSVFAPLQSPPRDTPPPHVEAGKAEAALRAEIDADGWTVDRGLALARFQEQRKAVDEAEQTLLTLRKAFTGEKRVLDALAAFYVRQGRAPSALELLEEAAGVDPRDKEAQYRLAVHYEEIVRRDQALSSEQKRAYAIKGAEAAQRALKIDPGYAEALVYQNILLRHQAAVEPDETRRQALTAEADGLRTQAMTIVKARETEKAEAAPAAAGCDLSKPVNGRTPVRGAGRPPTRTGEVRPVYPPEAQQARVQGLVILEIAIAEDGSVAQACVVRSIPLLDQAALDAVRQWTFEPPLVDGAPHPVRMTVTVNFTLQ